MTVALSTLVKYVTIEALGCPDFVVTRELSWSARRFCERTKVWREEQEVTYAGGSNGEVDIDTPDNSEIVSIDYVMADGMEISAVTEYALSATNRGWRSESGPAEAYISYPTKKLIRLFRTPQASTKIEYLATLRPNQDATSIPDFLDEMYRDALVDGAKWRILSQSGRPWHNKVKSDDYYAEFNRAISETTDKVFRGIATVNYGMYSPLV